MDCRVKLDGFDMLPVLQGEKDSPRAEMFWQWRGARAARVGTWKWVDGGKSGGLFDLSTDLAESHDLLKNRSEMASKVKGRFEAWRREMEASEPRGPFRDY